MVGSIDSDLTLGRSNRDGKLGTTCPQVPKSSTGGDCAVPVIAL
mgnify:CR=1 FL=1